MHSYTTDVTPEELRDSTREMAIALLACGIDPEKCILYSQSEVRRRRRRAVRVAYRLCSSPWLCCAGGRARRAGMDLGLSHYHGRPQPDDPIQGTTYTVV
jgi:hypothetical protein